MRRSTRKEYAKKGIIVLAMVSLMIGVTGCGKEEVEMVDFETWTKQEGNEAVCLVHWNEELGIQEIMPTLDESKTAYEIQDGDRFAIPFRSNIELIQILNGEKFVFENTEYLEIPLE